MAPKTSQTTPTADITADPTATVGNEEVGTETKTVATGEFAGVASAPAAADVIDGVDPDHTSKFPTHDLDPEHTDEGGNVTPALLYPPKIAGYGPKGAYPNLIPVVVSPGKPGDVGYSEQFDVVVTPFVKGTSLPKLVRDGRKS